MGVDFIQQARGVLALDFQFSQGADVYEADPFAHRLMFFAWRGIRIRPFPTAQQHHLRSKRDMAMVQGGMLFRLMLASGQHAEGNPALRAAGP